MGKYLMGSIPPGIYKTGHSDCFKVKPRIVRPGIPNTFAISGEREFHEREIFDLLGDPVQQPPGPPPYFLDENWVGYPSEKIIQTK